MLATILWIGAQRDFLSKFPRVTQLMLSGAQVRSLSKFCGNYSRKAPAWMIEATYREDRSLLVNFFPKDKSLSAQTTPISISELGKVSRAEPQIEGKAIYLTVPQVKTLARLIGNSDWLSDVRQLGKSIELVHWPPRGNNMCTFPHPIAISPDGKS